MAESMGGFYEQTNFESLMLDIDIADLKKISELIYQKYNYDFRNYAMSSFKRRVLRILELKKTNRGRIAKEVDRDAILC